MIEKSFKYLIFLFTVTLITGCSEIGFNSEPESIIRVTIDVKTEDELVSLLTPYATKYEYKLKVTRVHYDEPFFSVGLIGNESKIFGTNPFEINKYEFYIYAKNSSNKDQQHYEKLLHSLKVRIEGVVGTKP
jgi:hypothetical protein